MRQLWAGPHFPLNNDPNRGPPRTEIDGPGEAAPLTSCSRLQPDLHVIHVDFRSISLVLCSSNVSSPPLPPGHQKVGSPPPSSPVCLHPLSARAPRSQIELGLNAGRRLPVYLYFIPFSLLISLLV
jgi:hypothetical protein